MFVLLLPGAKPRASDANFDDLLSGQGFSGTKEKKGPRTIAEMRKEEMAKEMDPEKLKAGESLVSSIKTTLLFYSLENTVQKILQYSSAAQLKLLNKTVFYGEKKTNRTKVN